MSSAFRLDKKAAGVGCTAPTAPTTSTYLSLCRSMRPMFRHASDCRRTNQPILSILILAIRPLLVTLRRSATKISHAHECSSNAQAMLKQCSSNLVYCLCWFSSVFISFHHGRAFVVFGDPAGDSRHLHTSSLIGTGNPERPVRTGLTTRPLRVTAGLSTWEGKRQALHITYLHNA